MELNPNNATSPAYGEEMKERKYRNDSNHVWGRVANLSTVWWKSLVRFVGGLHDSGKAVMLIGNKPSVLQDKNISLVDVTKFLAYKWICDFVQQSFTPVPLCGSVFKWYLERSKAASSSSYNVFNGFPCHSHAGWWCGWNGIPPSFQMKGYTLCNE